MKTLVLSDQEASELQEFYLRELARAQRKLTHCQQILNKLESPVEIPVTKPRRVISDIEAIPSEVSTEKKKRGRPRKEEKAVAQTPKIENIPITPVKRGRPRKVQPVMEKVEAPLTEAPKSSPQSTAKRNHTQETYIESTIEKEETLRLAKEKKLSKKADELETKPGEKKIKQTNELGIKIPWTKFIMETLRNASHPMTAKEIGNLAIKQFNISDKNVHYVRNLVAANLSGLATRTKKIEAVPTEGRIKAYSLPRVVE